MGDERKDEGETHNTDPINPINNEQSCEMDEHAYGTWM